MFINYVALMLINLTASLALLAAFAYDGMGKKDARHWSPAFAIAGLVQLGTGTHMIWTWPLPGSHNVAFGEMSVLIGALFLGTALAQAMQWDLLPITIYAFLAGVAAIVVGVRLINLEMTKEPLVAGMGYVLSGLAGVLAPAGYLLRENRLVRILGTLLLLGAAAIWAVTGYLSYWGHMVDYAKWLPVTLR